MVLKLYGNSRSPSTNRVRLVLGELNVPYELVELNLQTHEEKQPQHVSCSPFGLLPYIVTDDGFTLFESRAICRYLTLTHSGVGKLMPDPSDVKKTALFEQALCVELANFDPLASGVALELVYKPHFKLSTDESMAARCKDILEKRFDGYERMLAKTRYLAGDEITLADLYHLPYGSMLKAAGIDWLESGRFPNVTRWWKEIYARPAWAAILSSLGSTF